MPRRSSTSFKGEERLAKETRQGRSARSHGVVLCRGTRSSELFLLDDLERILDQIVEDPLDLSRIVRVLVPSGILRGHLAGRLVSRRGGALGIVFQTLDGFVQELLESDPEGPFVEGDSAFPILVRNVAEAFVESPEGEGFGKALSKYEGGFGYLSEAVADLLDAGLTDAHIDALQESMRSQGSDYVREIGAGILNVSIGVRESYAQLSLGRRSDRYQRARELVETTVDNCRSKAIWIYGFADVTGVQGDLLEAILRYTNGQILIDQGSEKSPISGGQKYPDRLIERLSGVSGRKEVLSDQFEVSTQDWSNASSFKAECFEVVKKVGHLVMEGVLPENIVITARNLESHIQHLTGELRTRGLPYSITQRVLGETTQIRRRVLALLELQRLGKDALFDVWVAFTDPDAGLQHELRPWSMKRLTSLSLEPPKKISEPARRIWKDAQSFVHLIVNEPALSPLSFYQGLALANFSSDDSGLRLQIEENLKEMSIALPDDFRLRREDFVDLLDAAVAEIGLKGTGEAGGGVQLLSVTEARGVTCGHLFVLGMNKGLFPRMISEDPLLPDSLRFSLLDYLPDLPIKGRGKDEDRYLAAQLADAAPKVHWSYSQRDEDGLELSASPLLERLFLNSESEEIEPFAEDLVESSEYCAVREGLIGNRKAHQKFLTAALVRVVGQFTPLSPSMVAAVAEFRLKLGKVWDGPELTPDSPWGKVKFKNPPKLTTYATGIEALLKCPWKYFIENVLKFSSREKILDELPRFDPRTVGNGVHRVLQRIGENEGVPSSTSIQNLGSGKKINWPDSDRLDAILKETVTELLAEEGIYLPGFDRAFMEWIRAHVLNVRRLDSENLKWVGVEIDAECQVPTLAGGILQFRVDRVEELEGQTILTDFKTGIKKAKGLQAKAYARAVNPIEGKGRYLYTNPRMENQSGGSVADPEDLHLLDKTGVVVTELWREGIFSPRLTQGKGAEPDLCKYCGVRELCWRRGSIERRAYHKFISGEDPSSPVRQVFEVEL